MTDEAEVAQWLSRFEKRFGTSQTAKALQKMEDARKLFYNELGYNITRRQYENLRSAENDNVQQDIEEDLRRETGRHYINKQGQTVYQTNYRDLRTGRFTSRR